MAQTHHQRFLILDCYVDEPACLGVPPFIAPYPRYVFGALRDAGVPPEHIDYRTVDHLRENDCLLDAAYERVFVIGGAVVPGKYLGFRIGTVAEIGRMLARNPRQRFSVGGRVSRMIEGTSHPNAALLSGDIEKHAYHAARGDDVDAERNTAEIARWAVAGAPVVKRHPEYPVLICEMETYRGCPRKQRCSFCSENLRHGVSFREEADIIAEIDALAAEGISRFRLGSQPDILQYGSSLEEFRGGHPRPAPEKVIALLEKIRARMNSGVLSLLNVDNANPGTIARFPGESEEILAALAGTVTPGDTLALGVESFDPEVIGRNNLKVTAGDILPVVELVNRVGGMRVHGVPALLPGINLIHGLPGESVETFKINFRALEDLRDRGLLVKRINIRALNPFPGTPAAEKSRPAGKAVRNRYEYYRERIRAEIDHVMLKRVYPPGTLLTGMRIEDARSGYSYGRQIASYAITAKFPLELGLKSFVDAVVADHRERSVFALPVPIRINALPHGALKIIPGIGKRGAEKLILRRPFADTDSLEKDFPQVPGDFSRLMEF